LVDPNNSNVIYFLSDRDGFQVTYDGGKTWKEESGSDSGQIPRGPTGRGEAWITIDPSAGTVSRDGLDVSKVLYIGIAFDGVYRSEDGGAQWTRITDLIQEPNMKWNLRIPTGATVDKQGVLYVCFNALPGLEGDPKNAWSYDHGRWTLLPSPNWMQRGDIEVIPTIPPLIISTPESGDYQYRGLDTVYNGKPYLQSFNTENGRYFQSDGWTSARMKSRIWMMPDRAISYNPANPREVWIAAGMTIWKTDDVTGGGDPSKAIWKTSAQGLAETVDNQIRSLPAKGELKQGRIATAIDDLSGFIYSDLQNLDNTPTAESEYEGTNADGSLDDGLECTSSLAYEENNPINLVRATDNFVSLDKNFSGYSHDGGLSWKRFASFPQRTNGSGNVVAGRISVARNDPNNIVWAPWAEPMYFSRDGGASWEKAKDSDGKFIVNVARPFSFWDEGLNSCLFADPNSDNTFYAYPMSSGKLLRSSDGGESWAVASDMGNETQWPQMVRKDWLRAFFHPIPGNPGEIWVTFQEAPGDESQSAGLWHSTDGQNFSKVGGITYARGIASGPPLPGSNRPALYLIGTVIGQGDGIYRSQDDGKSWIKLLDCAEDQVGRFIFTRFTWLEGDRNVAGLVYVSTQGYGSWYCRSLDVPKDAAASN
jgi:photosystem II stability/assembly factor-like uncharacterized protein